MTRKDEVGVDIQTHTETVTQASDTNSLETILQRLDAEMEVTTEDGYGNVCFAGHNRGVNNHFGKIHTLEMGDTITLTTVLGTRTYAVTSVEKVSVNDSSGTAPTTDPGLVTAGDSEHPDQREVHR